MLFKTISKTLKGYDPLKGRRTKFEDESGLRIHSFQVTLKTDFWRSFNYIQPLKMKTLKSLKTYQVWNGIQGFSSCTDQTDFIGKACLISDFTG